MAIGPRKNFLLTGGETLNRTVTGVGRYLPRPFGGEKERASERGWGGKQPTQYPHRITNSIVVFVSVCG